MRKHFYLLFLPVFLSSCTSIIMNAIMKDAKVENTNSIKKFQTDNHYDTSNSFIVKADTATAMNWLQRGIASYEIYNSKGKLLQYIGTTDCGGVQFQYFLQNKLDSFKVDTTHSLKKILKHCYNYQNQKTTIKDLPQTDFYVVVYWAKFAGRKFGYKEGVGELENNIKRDTLKKHTITLIKINTDLQESWGMKPNGKMSVKIKVDKGGKTGDFVFGKLPIKK